MNEDAVKELQRISILDIAQLTDQDVAFLRARQSYLTAEQRSFYKEILEDKPVEVVPEQPVNEPVQVQEPVQQQG